MRNPPTPGALIFAKNLGQVAAFYEKLLALSVVHAESDHVVLESGNFQLIIHAIPEHIASSIAISVPPIVREEQAIKLLFPVPSLTQARSVASLLGGHLDPAHREWQAAGMRVCNGYDPEGNVFQLRQEVP
ncbi:VOC family protein [Lysobacter tyrosinilyticus]